MTRPSQQNLPPAVPGVYALVMRAAASGKLLAGKLGELSLQPGWYVYTGSALGPGGLRGRVGRHLRSTTQHWHIDYLKPYVELGEIWSSARRENGEHMWAGVFWGLPLAHIPWPGFGSSDCRCTSHLIYYPTCPSFDAFSQALSQVEGKYGPIQRLLFGPANSAPIR
jgi:Uri superfamily endonuclease